MQEEHSFGCDITSSEREDGKKMGVGLDDSQSSGIREEVMSEELERRWQEKKGMKWEERDDGTGIMWQILHNKWSWIGCVTSSFVCIRAEMIKQGKAMMATFVGITIYFFLRCLSFSRLTRNKIRHNIFVFTCVFWFEMRNLMKKDNRDASREGW